MKNEKILKIILKIISLFYLFLLLSFIIFTILEWKQSKEDSLFIVYFFLCFIIIIILPILFFNLFYADFFYLFRDRIRFKKLTEEECEIIADAKKIIKEVDLSIPSIEIKIYKIPPIPFFNKSWFFLDELNCQLYLFISFEKHLKYRKDLCFMVVVHEMLHAYNMRNSTSIFKINFLEGLNQFLTIWLIENYSIKYNNSINNKILIKKFSIGNFKFSLTYVYNSPYYKQVDKVKQYLSKYNIDIKTCYLNYINMNPSFFREKLPELYNKNN